LATVDTTPPTSLPGRPASPRIAFGALDAITALARRGCSAALIAVRESKFVVVGRGAGRQGLSGVSGRGLSAARSCIAAIICTLAKPSTAQWCNFNAIANEPFGTPATE